MSRILLHNLTVPYRRTLPDNYTFDQNGVFFAEPGDVVVMRAPSLSVEYMQYLTSIGAVSPHVTFVRSSQHHTDAFSIFHDDQLCELLRTHISRQPDEWAMDTFMFSSAESEWAQKLGFEEKVLPTVNTEFTSKSTFRSIAKRNGVLVPRGYENVASSFMLFVCVGSLLMRGSNEVVIKEDEGVAGLSSQRLRWKDVVRVLFSPTETLGIIGIQPVGTPYYVVEQWHPEVVSSPSVQGYIDREGNVCILSLHEQIFYENQMTYRGCRSHHWLDKKIQHILNTESKILMNSLAEEGYRGHVAFNAISLRNGEVYWVEMNPRRVMSSYPHKIVSRVAPKRDLPYISVQISRPEWKGCGQKEILDYCAADLFTPAVGYGVIPYDFRLLHKFGQVAILCIGETKEAAQLLKDRYEKPS